MTTDDYGVMSIDEEGYKKVLQKKTNDATLAQARKTQAEGENRKAKSDKEISETKIASHQTVGTDGYGRETYNTVTLDTNSKKALAGRYSDQQENIAKYDAAKSSGDTDTMKQLKEEISKGLGQYSDYTDKILNNDNEIRESLNTIASKSASSKTQEESRNKAAAQIYRTTIDQSTGSISGMSVDDVDALSTIDTIDMYEEYFGEVGDKTLDEVSASLENISDGVLTDVIATNDEIGENYQTALDGLKDNIKSDQDFADEYNDRMGLKEDDSGYMKKDDAANLGDSGQEAYLKQ